jgi:hypothetical protein
VHIRAYTENTKGRKNNEQLATKNMLFTIERATEKSCVWTRRGEVASNGGIKTDGTIAGYQ